LISLSDLGNYLLTPLYGRWLIARVSLACQSRGEFSHHAALRPVIARHGSLDLGSTVSSIGAQFLCDVLRDGEHGSCPSGHGM
jgi:hypothetical protein